MNAHTAMDCLHPPGALHFDLCGPVLAIALRRSFIRCDVTDLSRLAPILNVLGRTQVPEVYYTAILLMPWVDTQVACRHGDLWLFNTLHSTLVRDPFRRPLHFDVSLALQTACRHGHLAVLDRIIQLTKGTPPKEADCLGRAIWEGHTAVVDWYLQALRDSTDPAFRYGDVVATGLMAAVLTMNEPVVESLLSVTHPAFIGEPLAFACATGNLAWIKACQRKAVAVKTKGLVHHPASLPLAALFGHVHVMEWLLAQGAVKGGTQNDWCFYNSLGKSPKTRALLSEIAPTFGPVFLQRKEGLVCLTPFVAACAGSITAVEWVVRQPEFQGLLGHLSDQSKQLAIAMACMCGHVDVLDWLENTFAIAIVDEGKLINRHVHADMATEHGHLGVLEWLWTHVLKEYRHHTVSKDSLCQAIKKGQVAVLEWWRCNGNKQVLEPFTMVVAVKHGRMDVQEWWIQHTNVAMQPFSSDSLVQTLDWLYQHGLLDAGRLWDILDDAEVASTQPDARFFVADWLLNKGLGLKLVRSMFNLDPRKDGFYSNLLFLDFCVNRQLLLGPLDLNHASQHGHVEFLHWAVHQQHTVRYVYSSRAMHHVSTKDHVSVLEWWLCSGLPLKYDPDVVKTRYLDAEIRQWWRQSKLLHDE